MQAFTSIHSKLISLPVDDIDTDQIIPARFLKTTDKVGLGASLFADWRYLDDGSDNPDFVLNQVGMQGRQILLAGDNFGCGSSREHAPWALAAWGVRVIISTSFADIFYNNALKNGVLPVVVDREAHAQISARYGSTPDLELRVDLLAQELRMPDDRSLPFPIDAFSKRCLVEGKDQLGYILSFAQDIENYERGLSK